MAGFARASGDWKALGTGDFTVFYGPGHEGEAAEALRVLEEGKPSVTRFTGSLALGLPVTIEDAGLYANGFANPVYYQIHLFVCPPRVNDLFPVENWWELVAVHEYTHMSHMTTVSGIPGGLAGIFGRVLSPNIYTPMWFTEGLAVNAESSLSPYEGRLNDGFFGAYMLARAAEGRLPSLEQASVAPLEFPYGTGVYLYGGEFLSWLSRTHGGEGAFPRFVRTHGSRLLSYLSPVWPYVGADRTFRDVFGQRTPRLWKEWQDDLRGRAASFAIDGERITRTGWFAADLVADGNTLTYKRSYPVKTAAFGEFWFDEIVERDLMTGRERVLVTTTAGFMSRTVRRGGKLWYATAELGRGYKNTSLLSFGMEMQVHERDLATGKDRVVVQDRLRCFTVMPDGRLLLSRDRRGKFGSELAVLDPVTRKREMLLDSDLLVDELTADGRRVVATARADHECFSLFEFDSARRELRPLVRTPFLEGTPALAGDRLLFAANYGRVYSIYSLDFATGRLGRLTEGGFAVYPAAAGEWLYFVGMGSYGFDVYRRKLEPREAKLPEGAPFLRPSPSFDAAQARTEGYAANLATMVPALRLPFIDYEADDEGTAKRSIFGVDLMGADAVGDFPSYDVVLAYDSLERRPAFEFTASSVFAAPWQFAASGGNMEGKEMSVAALYPLRMAVSPGLTNLSVGASVDFFDDFTRRQATPFEHMEFKFPLTRVNADLVLPQERTGWGSAAYGESVYLVAGLTQYLPGSQLAVSTVSFVNTGDVATKLSPIRGYQDEIETASGAVVSADLARPVWKVHAGTWNPTVYLEDLVLGVFGDAITPEWAPALYSGGVELHLETWISNMGLALDWGGRLAWNRDGERTGEVFISSAAAGAGLRCLPRQIRGALKAVADPLEGGRNAGYR